MNAGNFLKLTRDVIVLLETQGVLTEDGSFDSSKFDTLQEDLAFAAALEAVLKTHGLDVPDRVERIIKLLPLLVGF